MIHFKAANEENTTWSKLSPIFFKQQMFSVRPLAPNAMVVTYTKYEDVPDTRSKLSELLDRICGERYSPKVYEYRYDFYFVCVEEGIQVTIENFVHSEIFTKKVYPLIKNKQIDITLIQGDSFRTEEWTRFIQSYNWVSLSEALQNMSACLSCR